MPLDTGTTELVLPGLDSADLAEAVIHPERTEPQTGHWIERGPQKRLMVFAGRSHPELAERIAEQLGVELGEVTLKSFANGETYIRYDESIRGSDLFIVQTGCDPIDRNLMELLQMVQAAKLGSAKRITAVIPLFPYARQDRKAKPREPITARLVADLLQVAGADRILTMDLHAGQIQGFFTIPVDHMTALPLFARHFRDLGLTGEGIVSVSPDTGRAKQAERFAEMIEAEFAIMHKSRPAHDVASVTEIAGRVRGKTAIIGDDVIMTGGTMMANVRALGEHGASDVWLFATHGLFCDDSLERFAETDEIKGIVVTDTVPIDPLSRPEKLTVLPASNLLAETIMNVFADDSVSAIFGGENQLF
jgi:ribose-phosphate pyrophosphokinase